MRPGTETEYLFVYGTLMRSAGYPLGRRLLSEAVHIGPAQVPGRLYSLGSYPGLVHSDGQWDRVHGEVLRLTNPARSLIWLDEYEGCSLHQPEPHDYERIIAPVTLQDRQKLYAYIYYYRGHVAEARRITGGRFLGAARAAVRTRGHSR